MGVWIETSLQSIILNMMEVTPFVGVWIETVGVICRRLFYQSHPSWVCGLKLLLSQIKNILMGHTLRGCVD